MAINNTVPGLISPFLSPQKPLTAGGSNTSYVAPTQGGLGASISNATSNFTGANQMPGYIANTSSPTASSINFSGLIKPNPSNTIPNQTSMGNSGGINSYGLNSSSPNWYQLQPGETTQNYYARTQGQTQSQALSGVMPINTSGTSQGSGMGGGQAPAGMMYNGQGQLVPIDNSQTVNASGQNAPVSTNVATGGGTQTNFPSIVGGLASTAATSSPQYQAAQQQYLDANQELANLKTQAAQQNANIQGSRTNLAEAGGEAGLLQNLTANSEAALTGEMSAAQAAAASATGQQNAQQSGLAAAGGLVQPQQVGPTNVPFNPLTEQYGSPAAGAYGSSGSNGLQNVGGIQGQINIGQNIAQLNSSLGGAQAVGQNLQNLISQNNINPSGLTYANGALQFGQQALSNPAYQEFQGQVNDFIASLAPILGVGGNVTDMKTQMSSQIVNALQSGQSINQVISYFLNQAKQKIRGLQSGGGAINTNGTQSNTSGGTNFGSFFA